MQPRSKITNIWNESLAPLPYRSGVSLHSHTSMSEETLMFIHKMFVFHTGVEAGV